MGVFVRDRSLQATTLNARWLLRMKLDRVLEDDDLKEQNHIAVKMAEQGGRGRL